VGPITSKFCNDLNLLFTREELVIDLLDSDFGDPREDIFFKFCLSLSEYKFETFNLNIITKKASNHDCI